MYIVYNSFSLLIKCVASNLHNFYDCWRKSKECVLYYGTGTPNQLFPFTFMGFVFGALANATLWVKFRALLAWPGLMGVCLS
jgi:hypothetical protein